jgi:hypothetical protein
VVIENDNGLLAPFIEQGWHLTQRLDIANAIETARAFVFRGPARDVTGQALSVRPARGHRPPEGSIDAQRTLSSAPLVGSREIFGSQGLDWWRQWRNRRGADRPDPEPNNAQDRARPRFRPCYLLQDLLMSGVVERFGFVDGVGAAPMAAREPDG